jgi:deoxyribonuclease-4
MHLLGTHIDSSLDNIIDAINEAKSHSANFVQFFVNTTIKDQHIYDKIKQHLISNNMKCTIHASYTINLAQNWDNYTWSIQQLINEINLASKVGAIAIVVHLGKKLQLSLQEAINNMYTSLIHIHQETKHTKVKILLETSTGQGSEIGNKLDELAIIYRKFSKHKNSEIVDRFGICFDTCHVFSSGYNFHNKESIEIFFDNFNELLGIKEIKLVHLNDSKVPCGAQVDRHENIGRGHIGKKMLIALAIAFKNLGIPIILETSYPRIYDDLKILLKEI